MCTHAQACLRHRFFPTPWCRHITPPPLFSCRFQSIPNPALHCAQALLYYPFNDRLPHHTPLIFRYRTRRRRTLLAKIIQPHPSLCRTRPSLFACRMHATGLAPFLVQPCRFLKKLLLLLFLFFISVRLRLSSLFFFFFTIRSD